MSPPAQNAFPPVPLMVRTRGRASGSAFHLFNSSIIKVHISLSTELRALGEFSFHSVTAGECLSKRTFCVGVLAAAAAAAEKVLAGYIPNLKFLNCSRLRYNISFDVVCIFNYYLNIFRDRSLLILVLYS